jgi:solute:Na+ symporter, SSS family
MGHFGIIDTIVLVVYFAAMAGIGVYFARRNKTTEGYFVGDRNFPGWLIGFSIFATSISSMTFIGFPADGYKTAWYRMTPNFALPIAVIIATTFFLPFFRRSHVTSAYEYLEARFGPKTRVYAAAAFILNQVVRLSIILYLVSVLLHEITGLDPYVSILVGALITSFYTIMGGIRAVLWTDFIQSLVLWGGGVAVIFALLYKIPGGLGEVISLGTANNMVAEPGRGDSDVVLLRWAR